MFNAILIFNAYLYLLYLLYTGVVWVMPFENLSQSVCSAIVADWNAVNLNVMGLNGLGMKYCPGNFIFIKFKCL